jgi:hypothetical protein
MNPNMIRAGLLTILFSIHFSCPAQLYDFDSLYQNSTNFKEEMDAIRDTFDIFNSDQILPVTITSDFKNLVKRKFKDEYQPATIEIILFDSIKVKTEIAIRPRGKFRREFCYFPPIKMKFPKKEAFFKQFQEFNEVKLVGNCKSGDLYKTYILQEYYVYKMYNLLTPFSYRVRLLKVKYIDISGKKKPRDNYAFVIESTDQMAERLNGADFERKGLNAHLIDRKTGTIMELFQFMVGNTDYSIANMHNIKFIKVADANHPRPVAIPYDFDYCGLINTFYAVPHERVPIENVRQRYYKGGCRELSEYEEAFKIFYDKRADIESLFKNSENLTDGSRKGPLDYIDEFYKIIGNKSSAKSYIVNNCR